MAPFKASLCELHHSEQICIMAGHEIRVFLLQSRYRVLVMKTEFEIPNIELVQGGVYVVGSPDLVPLV